MSSVDRSNPAEKVADHQRHGRGRHRVPYPIGIREATVIGRTWVTERMVRLTFGGSSLDGLHTYVADDHVKLLFPDHEGRLVPPVPDDRQMLDWDGAHSADRAYTIRRYDATARELDIDVVLHDGGVASDWATTVEIGATVPMAGPPGGAAFPLHHAHYLLVVDSTALPAVGRFLAEEAPAAARVDVVVAVEHPAQRDYPLSHPGLRLQWLDAPVPAEQLLGVADAALDADPTGAEDTFLFAAGEADLIKPLRSWAKQRGVESSIRGYWKRGVEGFDD